VLDFAVTKIAVLMLQWAEAIPSLHSASLLKEFLCISTLCGPITYDGKKPLTPSNLSQNVTFLQ